MSFALTLWVIAATMLAAALSVIAYLIVARILRDGRSARQARLAAAVQATFLRTMGGQDLEPEDATLLRSHPDIVATALLQFAALVRGEERDRLFTTLADLGLFAVLRTVATSRSSPHRLIALEALALFPGSEAARVLRTSRRDPDFAIRFAATSGLVARGEVVSIRRLIDNLTSLDDAPSGRVIEIIGRVVRQDPRAALRALEGPEAPTAVRAAILQAVGAAGDYGLIDELKPWAAHAEPDVRSAAIDALGMMRHPATETVIAAALDDLDWTVRRAAIRAVGMGGFTRQIDVLAERMSDPLWSLRFEAARALWNIGGVGVVRLQAAAGDDDPKIRDLASATLAELAAA